jgi:hypothetical protein
LREFNSPQPLLYFVERGGYFLPSFRFRERGSTSVAISG